MSAFCAALLLLQPFGAAAAAVVRAAPAQTPALAPVAGKYVPEILWDIELPDSVQGGVAAGDGMAYVALMDGTLRGYAIENGKEAWKKDLEASPQTGAAYAKGTVLVADSLKRLRAFAAPGGEAKWEAPLKGQASSEIGGDDYVVCVGEGNKSCAAFWREDGRKLWRMATFGDVVGAPWAGEQTVVFGSTGHKLYSVAKLTGQAAKEIALPGEVYGRPGGVSGTPERGLVAVGTHNGRLLAFSVTGKELWTAKVRGVVRAAPLVLMGEVFAGTDAALLYCFSRDDGKMRWRTGIGGPVAGRLILLSGHLVVGAGRAISFVDPRTGEIGYVIGVDGLVCGLDRDGGTIVAVTTGRRLVAVGPRPQEAVAAPRKAPLLVSVVVDPAQVNMRGGRRACVSFSLREPAPLRVEVCDCRGKRVKLLVSRERAWPDTYRCVWDGLNDDGRPVVPGVYRMRVVAGEEETNVGIEVVGRR